MWVSFQCIFYLARTEIEMTLFTTHFQKKRDLTDYIFSQKISSRYFLTCFAFQSIIFIWGQMKKKFTFILLCLVIGISTVVAQNTKVAGSVISADDGLPVIGASIVVKGTMVGIVTDYDGNFTLEVPSNGKVLIVSYVGMLTQEVPVSPNVRVVLKSDTQNLDEVVVTAMGISKEKKALGYAVQDVKGEKLTQAATGY